MQAGLAGAPKEAPRKGQRKIRPTVPVLAAGRAPSVAVPAAVAQMAAGERDEANQELQSTFLAMYSNLESKVCLRKGYLCAVWTWCASPSSLVTCSLIMHSSAGAPESGGGVCD